MKIFKETKAISKFIKDQKEHGTKIGFVPTMGALHVGHISLVEMAKSESDLTIASIFVNPTQFNDPKDFEKYPVTLPADIKMLEEAGCDILFCPGLAEIYPEGSVFKKYDLGFRETILEGKYRPGHFQGVCQVVHRLLNIIQPDNLFLGQKDFQQCLVIEKLIQLENIPVKVIKAETIREPNGLAMSSRNMRLNADHINKAATIYRILDFIKANIDNSTFEALEKYAKNELLENGFHKIDYVIIADARTLEPLENRQDKKEVVALVAAFLGDVRLIDNMVIK